jgi:hypothetical protein
MYTVKRAVQTEENSESTISPKRNGANLLWSWALVNATDVNHCGDGECTTVAYS